MCADPVILVCCKVFTRKYQLSLKPEAIAYLENVLDEYEIEDDQVQEAVEYMAKEYMKQDGEAQPMPRNPMHLLISFKTAP